MPAYTVLEGEILKSITWTVISWNLHLSGSGQTIKWSVDSDRPAKRPEKKRAVRWSRKVMGARSQAATWVRMRTLAFTFCDFTTTGGSWSEERSPLTWAHTRSLWLLSYKSNEGKQNQKREAIAKIRWNIMVAWNRGVAKVVTSGQKILDIFWK